jgi:hypothetical protein
MEPCGFVTDESKPRRIEKLHFEAANFRERVVEAYCLLKLAALILFAGAAEVSFETPKEEKPSPPAAADRQPTKTASAGRQLERRWKR